jgi:hypothetical protein
MSAPTLYRLIAVYWDRYASFDEETRKLEASEKDTPAYKKIEAAYSRASDRLTDSFAEVCGFLPKWKFEAKLKARFIEQVASDSGSDIEPEALAALLKATAQLVLPPKEGVAP